jgi:hypothetical protein
VAVADTARLIAALELQDKFSGPARGIDRSLGGLDRRIGGVALSAQRMGQGMGRAVSNIAKLGASAAVAGVGLLAINIKAGVDSLNELENVTVATNTVIASTKGVAGQTADAVRDLSEKYEDLNATMDDKVIQSGANMLLTFTNVREKAFEPALEAALNMNEAMGGGPEGLQTTIIQVGKALNDPIKGVGALRRVGVQLNQQQEDQIKTLVEQNDLYGAQQIILDELATQFGGRFAAAGKTAEGSQARLADKIEDVQKALAGPLLPAIDRVREKLTDFLGSERVLQGAERLGQAIANLFSNDNLDSGVAMLERGIDALSNGDFKGATGGLSSIVSSVSSLPWASIGDAARLLGTGSKALLDAFTSLPSWVQTAVLTGWGLNKLTGGALGGIVGELGKGLVKGVLGMNAGVVNINAATVNGAPVAGAPAKGSSALGLLGTVTIAGAALTALTTIATEVNKTANPTGFNFNELASQLGQSRVAIESGVNTLATEFKVTPDAIRREMIPLLEAGNMTWDEIVAEVRESKSVQTSIDRNMLTTATRIQNSNDLIRRAKDAASFDAVRLRDSVGQVGTKVGETNRISNSQLSRQYEALAAARGGNATLEQIRQKKSSVSVHTTVNTSVVISAQQMNFQLQSLRESVGGDGFI